MKKYIRYFLLVLSQLSIADAYAQLAPRLLPPVRSPAGAIALRIEGTAEQPMQLQFSVNNLTWTTLQTVSLTGSTVTVYDQPPSNSPQRFYRLRGSSGPVVPLPDLTQEPNNVFIAGEGFNTLQFAPSGKLGFIAWRGIDLILRERATD